MIKAIFGCKNTTKFLIESLSKRIDIDYLITIDEEKGKKFDVADYCDLTETANKYDINVYKSKTYSLKRKEDIDYIKIDAEGYELEALRGADKLIEKCRPFIHIEAKKKVMVKQNITMNAIEELFKRINYKQVLSVKSELLYAPK
mgnify:CR=1 FL=1